VFTSRDEALPMVGKYSKNQLKHRGDSHTEHNRLRNIFDDLVARGRTGHELSMVEQDFVYHGITFFNENPNNFSFVDDARFKDLYLTYAFDITGGSTYVKARNGEIIDVPILERQNDLNYLIEVAESWETKIAFDRHQDPLMQIIGAEFRIEKKELDKSLNINGQPQLVGTYYYQYKVWNTNLRARIVYIYTKKIFEEITPTDCTYSLCGETIEFTQDSMVHILNRHFAEITKQFKSGKDYHLEDIVPWIMPKQIKDILLEIDKSNLLTRQVKTEINLKYKGQIYQLWASIHHKQKKGIKGNIEFKMLDSFYPVSDSKILSKLKSSYKETILNDEVSLFIPI
jgi:hypothetical protein